MTEQGLRRLTPRVHSRVHQVCHVIVGFHVLDVGFHVVIECSGRLTVQQDAFCTYALVDFTIRIRRFQVQPSFLLSMLSSDLSCHRRLSTVYQILACFTSAKTGPLRCCLYRMCGGPISWTERSPRHRWVRCSKATVFIAQLQALHHQNDGSR